MKHTDFGEKIGGARKDLWGARGLLVSDLEEMNLRELDAYITKQNVWLPKYEEMLKAGYDKDLLVVLKYFYDNIDKSPYLRGSEEVQRQRSQSFVSLIREFKDIFTDKTKLSELEDDLQEFLERNDIFEIDEQNKKYIRHLNGQWIGNPFANKNFTGQLYWYFSSPEIFLRDAKRYCTSKQFLIPKEQRVPPGYKIIKNCINGKEIFRVYKSYSRMGDDFENYEDALKYARDLSHDSRTVVNRYVPPQLLVIERTGPKFRNYGEHANGQKMLDVFGFRGGEFGNWLTDADRQKSLDMAYDSLKDLARALNISYQSIGLNHTLAIAFGSRGRSRALAHYEPARQVINLTKMNGAGSLAHEWFHALDDYLGMKIGSGNFASKSGYKYGPMKELVDSFRGTEFLKESIRLDEKFSPTKDYWSKVEEMCARAFACYVADKLDYKSDYIVGHAYLSPGIPRGEEAKIIFEKFDHLFEEICKDNYLTLDQHTAEIEKETAASRPEVLSGYDVPDEYSAVETESGEQITFDDILNSIEKNSTKELAKKEMTDEEKILLADTTINIDD